MCRPSIRSIYNCIEKHILVTMLDTKNIRCFGVNTKYYILYFASVCAAFYRCNFCQLLDKGNKGKLKFILIQLLWQHLYSCHDNHPFNNYVANFLSIGAFFLKQGFLLEFCQGLNYSNLDPMCPSNQNIVSPIRKFS